MPVVVDVAPNSDFTLVVTDEGELEARQPLHDDRVQRFSTARNDYAVERETDSEYGLRVAGVLERYQAYGHPDRTLRELAVATAIVYKDYVRGGESATEREGGQSEARGVDEDDEGEESGLNLSERQRRVLENLGDGDAVTPGQDAHGSALSPRWALNQVEYLLYNIDNDELDADQTDRLVSAIEAVKAVIQAEE